MKLRKQLHWLVYFAFILSCARQTAPTGGPKDTIPPRLVRSNPANQQINFHDNKLALTFSEFVQLNKPKEQLIITPSIGKDYKVTAKRQLVEVTWDRPLDDSTTYTFNFRDAVQDMTEKNPAKKLRIAVSTGSYIDSLSIQGTTVSLLDETTIKDATVALQPYSDTFSIFKHSPTYFTKADDKGNYKLENLKSGTYLIYAWMDQNKNLTVDSKSERYGFLADSVLLTSNLKKVDLGLIKLDARPLTMTSARPYNTYFNIRNSKNIANIHLKAVDTTKLSYALSSDPSIAILYNTFPEKDSLQIHISLTDSIQQRFDTTVYAKFNKQRVTPEKFKASLLNNIMLADEGVIEASFKFSKPVMSINFDSLYFDADSLHRFQFNRSDIKYDTTQLIIHLKHNFDKALYKKSEPQPTEAAIPKQPTIKRLNLLKIGKGAFISIENDSSAQMDQKVTPHYFEDLGVIIAQVNTENKNVIIQLLDTKKNVLQQAIHKTQYTFNNLSPGDYLLRVIIDSNNNGKWDPGNYFLRQEPEKVLYYKNEKQTKEIKLKANFELGPLLITY